MAARQAALDQCHKSEYRIASALKTSLVAVLAAGLDDRPLMAAEPEQNFALSFADGTSHQTVT